MSRPITPMERALAEAMDAACSELDAAVEAMSDAAATRAQLAADETLPHMKVAWRRLQDGLVALEQEVDSCPDCSRWVGASGCGECMGDAR